MTKQIKPLLACEVPLEQVRLPVYVSTKLDGIRCVIIGGVAVYESNGTHPTYTYAAYFNPALANEEFRVKGTAAAGAYRDWETDRKSTRLNSSHSGESRMPSSA